MQTYNNHLCALHQFDQQDKLLLTLIIKFTAQVDLCMSTTLYIRSSGAVLPESNYV